MFPGITLPKPSDIEEVHKKRIHRNHFESGYKETRPKETRSRKTFTISWSDPTCLSHAEKIILTTFFDANLGGNFVFTNPWTLETFTCVFKTDEISFSEVIPGQYYNATLTIEEM